MREPRGTRTTLLDEETATVMVEEVRVRADENGRSSGHFQADFALQTLFHDLDCQFIPGTH